MSRGKSEIRISNIETNWSKIQNQETMSHNENSKRYDLEERTFEFAKASRAFVKQLPRTISNIEDVKQFIRASGSIGANYIEANEAIGKKELRDENQDLPPRSQRKPLLASFNRHRWKTGSGSSAYAGRSRRADENLRRNRPQIRIMNIFKIRNLNYQTAATPPAFQFFCPFEFSGVCLGFRDSNFEFV